MDSVPSDLQPLLSLLPFSRFLTLSTSDPAKFRASSAPWSLAHDRHPHLVIEPATEAELSVVVRYLTGDKGRAIDFAVRGSGCGNSSARDVVISMAGFKEIVFDQQTERCTVGAGNDWGEVDAWLEGNARDYVVVGSRCPFVGVAGSTLMGGLSWLSSALGLGSDPCNLLDARIILFDGRAVWASSERPLTPGGQDSELLWALRGGGGNFGVVTSLVLKAHRVYDDAEDVNTTKHPDIPNGTTTITTTIPPSLSLPRLRRKPWSGMIRFPNSLASLPAVSRSVSTFASRNDASSVGLALHVFIVDFSAQALHGGAATPDLVLLPFDPYGEEHARSEAGFRWALDLPGADASLCAEMTLAQVHALQAGERKSHGKLESWMQAALVGGGVRAEDGRSEGGHAGDGVVDEDMVTRCWDWYVETLSNPGTKRLGVGAFALLEIMQAPAMMGSERYRPSPAATASSPADSSADSPPIGSSTAWPHATLGRKNILQLGVGCEPASTEEQRQKDEEVAYQLLREFPTLIAKPGVKGAGEGWRHPASHFLPNFTHAPQVHDLSAIFGGNWERLRKVKRWYDPTNRFDKGLAIPPAERVVEDVALWGESGREEM